MQLSFYPRGGAPVRIPGAIQIMGQPACYLGRTKAEMGKDHKGSTIWGYPANGRAYVCDSDSEAGRRLVKLLKRDEALWPADEATARHCGVAYVDVKLVDGEWVEAKPTKKAIPKPSKGGSSEIKE